MAKNTKVRPVYYPKGWQSDIDKRMQDIGETSFASYIRKLIKQDTSKQKQYAS